MSWLAESAASDLKKLVLFTPSKVSASKPEPAPSTVLIAVSISLADWSAVAPFSTFINDLTAAAVPCHMYPSLAVSTHTFVIPLVTSLGLVLK